MLDKAKKIIYIIVGSLTIISLVFMLAKKVGLCASSDTSNLLFDSTLPLPIGEGYGYNSSVVVFDSSFVQAALSYLNSNKAYDYMPDFCLITLEENNYSNSGYYTFLAYCPPTSSGVVQPFTFTVTTNSNNIPTQIKGVNTYQMRFRWYPDTNTFSNISYIGYRVWTLNLYGSNNYCFGSNTIDSHFIFSFNRDFVSYPIFADLDILSSDYFSYVGSGGSSGDSDWNDVIFPDFSDLPDSVDSSSSDYNLYSWLNGQNNSNYDYTKSIFDLIKGFFSWVASPLDEDSISEEWDNSPVNTVYSSFNNISDSLESSFNVSPAQRIVIPISFAGTPFSYVPDQEINFDWWTSDMRDSYGRIIVIMIGMIVVVLFLRGLPGMISGASSVADELRKERN